MLTEFPKEKNTFDPEIVNAYCSCVRSLRIMLDLAGMDPTQKLYSESLDILTKFIRGFHTQVGVKEE